MTPTGFARIPRSPFRFVECQSCYFHNREPAICESCLNGEEFQPADNLDETLSARKAGIVRFYRRAPAAPVQIQPDTEEKEAA